MPTPVPPWQHGRPPQPVYPEPRVASWHSVGVFDASGVMLQQIHRVYLRVLGNTYNYLGQCIQVFISLMCLLLNKALRKFSFFGITDNSQFSLGMPKANIEDMNHRFLYREFKIMGILNNLSWCGGDPEGLHLHPLFFELKDNIEWREKKRESKPLPIEHELLKL